MYGSARGAGRLRSAGLRAERGAPESGISAVWRAPVWRSPVPERAHLLPAALLESAGAVMRTNRMALFAVHEPANERTAAE